MNKFVHLLIAALAVIATNLLSVNAEASENFEILFGDDFETRLKAKLDDQTNVLVLFMAPWCSNCKMFTPEFQSAAQRVKSLEDSGEISKTIFAEIDADNFRDIAKKYEIEAFPTLKWFPAGSSIESGEPVAASMDTDGVVSFVKKHALKPMETLKDSSTLGSFLKLRETVTYKDALVVLATKDVSKVAAIREAMDEIRKADTDGLRFAVYESTSPMKDVEAGLGGAVSSDGAEEGLVVILSDRHGVKVQALSKLPSSEATKTFLLEATAIPSDVVELTSANFQSTLNENEFVVVEFYAPWCGYCQRLAPVYENLAAMVKSEGLNVVVAKVDATAEENIGAEYGIEGFPTLKWVRKGQAFEFSHERQDPAVMVDWIKSKMGPTFVKELEAASKADVDSFLASYPNQRAAVLLVPGNEIAESLEQGAYGASPAFAVSKNTPAATFEALEAQSGPIFVVVNEAGIVSTITADDADFQDPLDVAIQVNVYSMPTISKFSDDFLDEAIESGSELIYFIICSPSNPALKSIEEFAKTVSRRYALFAHIDPSDADMDYALEFFEVNVEAGSDRMFIRAVSAADIENGGGIYPLLDGDKKDGVPGKEVTVERLQAFAQGIKDGEVEPFPEKEDPYADAQVGDEYYGEQIPQDFDIMGEKDEL
mmetsp:Transcript_462/g.1115  ORF Transcript_462/g.1115 Transcript_462/m.1115 type:complete len:655 (+) Transcript_462:353-2317(+)|eukprot:CAMPEP_0171489932 /NCGR_PEP_ID=MMETSP0958-20121227/3032_1 /TAXON_ID=87120 /ORGANISM="Aurantiochytrium limacinum, Strain ATCCMYA-1381" /LENGTH=654 /DNA_ID=CAMNT_0012023201 /DNA_START=276 /DNA_END=2240 /DNA_ORIENTATION=+